MTEGKWQPYDRGSLPRDGWLVAVEFADGSVSAAVTNSEFELGLCIITKLEARVTSRQLPATPIRMFLVPAPPTVAR